MNKKGVELTLNTIIILALALIVLVVLSIIFFQRANIFNQSVNPDCESQQGVCMSQCPPDKMAVYAKCPDGKIGKCCIPPPQ